MLVWDDGGFVHAEDDIPGAADAYLWFESEEEAQRAAEWFGGCHPVCVETRVISNPTGLASEQIKE